MALGLTGFTKTLAGTFTAYTVSGTLPSGDTGWFGPIPGAPNAPGYPLVVAKPDVNARQLLYMDPGTEYAVVRWTAPAKGMWDVVGHFQGLGATRRPMYTCCAMTLRFLI